MNAPLFEVIVHDDGQVTYRVRPSNLDAVQLGVVLAALARYLAQGIVAENPRADVEITLHTIIRNMLAAIEEKDDTQAPLRRLN